MESFAFLLQHKVDRPQFKYHWRCGQHKINHVSFADDLFLVASADEVSLKVIKDTLKEFGIMSGLRPNLAKSTMYMADIPQEKKEELAEMMGMTIGELPVRYLGVPFITTKLKATHCKAIVEKITSRTMHWFTRFLSYAERLTLIKSVLFSIQVYWSSLFILPKAILKEISGLLRNFLWNGSDIKKKGFKVKWQDVCLPCDEGGLGIKDLLSWNTAATMKHLWDIARKKDSL